MPNLKEIIAKHNAKQDITPLQMRGLLISTAQDILENLFAEIKDKLIRDIEQQAEQTLKERLTRIKDIKGDKGDKGEDGRDGIDGVDGVDGRIGKDGKNGKNGQDGQQGIQGEKGKDGSPDIPNQIADKLNTLTEIIEISVIKGLEKRFESLTRSISEVSRQKSKGGGGGGIGNVQHETKNVSSSTTTIITSYPISGGGFAVWGFYQGGQIQRGTHYSVGADNKTLTLLFTPDDNTQITLIYIRG